jgi:tRNA threonylcarbamoyl adenosine modification protein YeaZ
VTNWLGVDTSMNACGVAIRRTDGKFFSQIEVMERGQAERLMPMIVDIAKQAGIGLNNIDAYAVTNGPGTFTGLRVGLATVRALAQASGRSAIGVGTFDALSGAAPQPTCILLETKRTDYYVRAPGMDDACISPEDLKNIIRPDWILLGDAVERAVSELALKNKTIPVISVPLDLLIARAETMTAQGLPDPVYLRGADVSTARKKVARII